MLDDLIKEIENLKEAKELLEKVFVEIGPYGDGELTQETRWKINDYMGFDDSE